MNFSVNTSVIPSQARIQQITNEFNRLPRSAKVGYRKPSHLAKRFLRQFINIR